LFVQISLNVNYCSSGKCPWGRSGASPKPLAIGCRTSPTNEAPPRIQAFSHDPAAGPHERLSESPGPTLMSVFLEFPDEKQVVSDSESGDFLSWQETFACKS